MMRGGKANRGAQAFLSALGALFAVMLGMELGREYAPANSAAPPPADVAAPAPRNAGGRIFPLSPFPEYWIISRRSLFHESRRAPDADNRLQDGLVEELEPLNFSLSAIIIANDKRIALIRPNDDNRLKKLAEGDTYRGWLLTKVLPRAISLQRGAEKKQLQLVAAPAGGQEPPGGTPFGGAGAPERW